MNILFRNKIERGNFKIFLFLMVFEDLMDIRIFSSY